MCRSVLGVPALYRHRTMGHTCPRWQAQNRTISSRRCFCMYRRTADAILSLSRSSASRRTAAGTPKQQGHPRSSPSRLPASGLLCNQPLHSNRPAPAEAHFRNRDASRRRELPCTDEVTRSHKSGNDHALRRCGVDRPSERVPSGPIQPTVSDTTTQGLISTTACRHRWRHRLLARCSARARHVPQTISNRRLSIMPRQALQSPHQDPPRGTQTTYRMRAGRFWPVKPVLHEQCQNIPLFDADELG